VTLVLGLTRTAKRIENTVEEISEVVSIVNSLGMHARPAASLVQTVLQFQSEVYLELDGNRVNAKSIMGLLTLAAARGTKVKVICKGADAQQAMDAVRELIEAGFGED